MKTKYLKEAGQFLPVTVFAFALIVAGCASVNVNSKKKQICDSSDSNSSPSGVQSNVGKTYFLGSSDLKVSLKENLLGGGAGKGLNIDIRSVTQADSNWEFSLGDAEGHPFVETGVNVKTSLAQPGILESISYNRTPRAADSIGLATRAALQAAFPEVSILKGDDSLLPERTVREWGWSVREICLRSDLNTDGTARFIRYSEADDQTVLIEVRLPSGLRQRVEELEKSYCGKTSDEKDRNAYFLGVLLGDSDREVDSAIKAFQLGKKSQLDSVIQVLNGQVVEAKLLNTENKTAVAGGGTTQDKTLDVQVKEYLEKLSEKIGDLSKKVGNRTDVAEALAEFRSQNTPNRKRVLNALKAGGGLRYETQVFDGAVRGVIANGGSNKLSGILYRPLVPLDVHVLVSKGGATSERRVKVLCVDPTRLYEYRFPSVLFAKKEFELSFYDGYLMQVNTAKDSEVFSALSAVLSPAKGAASTVSGIFTVNVHHDGESKSGGGSKESGTGRNVREKD